MHPHPSYPFGFFKWGMFNFLYYFTFFNYLKLNNSYVCVFELAVDEIDFDWIEFDIIDFNIIEFNKIDSYLDTFM